MEIILFIALLYAFYTYQDNQKKIKELESEIEQLTNQIEREKINNN